jgi:hypothetical protein
MTIIYGGNDPQKPAPPKAVPDPPNQNTLELVIENHSYACRHMKVMINCETRSVWCRDCKAVMDPFDALLKMSKDSSNFTQGLDWKKRAHAKIEEEEAHLRAIVSKLKSELKKLGIPYCVAHLQDPEQMAQWSGLPVDTLKRAKSLDERFPTRKPKAKLTSIIGGKKP